MNCFHWHCHAHWRILIHFRWIFCCQIVGWRIIEYNPSTNRIQGGLVLLKIHNCSHLTATSPQTGTEHPHSVVLLEFAPSPSSWRANSLTWRMWTPNHEDIKGVQGAGCKTKIVKRRFQDQEDTRTTPEDGNSIRAQAAPPPHRPQARQRLLPPPAGRSLQLQLRLRLLLRLRPHAHPERRQEGARRLVERRTRAWCWLN